MALIDSVIMEQVTKSVLRVEIAVHVSSVVRIPNEKENQVGCCINVASNLFTNKNYGVFQGLRKDAQKDLSPRLLLGRLPLQS